jgi:hypothetical protein
VEGRKEGRKEGKKRKNKEAIHRRIKKGNGEGERKRGGGLRSPICLYR